LQIGQIAGNGFLLGMSLLELLEFQEQFVRSFMFETMQMFTQPGLTLWGVFTIQGFSDQVDMFGSVGKIENANGVRTVIVCKALMFVNNSKPCSHLLHP